MLLTRIFSVTLWYHFAFMAISIAMFGLTCGALIVHLLPQKFSIKNAHAGLSYCSWLFSVSVLFSVLVHTFTQEILQTLPIGLAWSLYAMLTFPLMAIPFVFSGIVVTIALTRFPSQVSSLYACDLLGASCGCLLLSALLSISDCFTAIVIVAATGSAAAFYFGLDGSVSGRRMATPLQVTPVEGAQVTPVETSGSTLRPLPIACCDGSPAVLTGGSPASDQLMPDNFRGDALRRPETDPSSPVDLSRLAAITCAIMLLLACVEVILSKNNIPLLKLQFVKGNVESGQAYEKWNSFSRIRISGNPNEYSEALGWGLSSARDKSKKIRQLFLNIDGAAATVLTAFSGDKTELSHLPFDVTNIGHYLRGKADVLVIGVGGGRDLLSALAFNQKSVTGVEINQDIIDAVTKKFADFTGHIEQIPGVKVINDEARSYVARSPNKFDIIQVSLIDTWAASTAGGLSLSENSLYTIESWKIFLNHLTPNGILSFSRWCGEPPAEVYKLLVLANKSLAALGISDPRAHIILVKGGQESGYIPPVATMLVSKEAFSKDDLETIKQICSRLKFEILLSPEQKNNKEMAGLAENPEALIPELKINVAAPTDDCPFFFQMMPLSGLGPALFDWRAISLMGNAIIMLFWLLALVLSLSAVCIVWPLSRCALRFKLAQYSGKLLPLLGYFLSIGLAFMLIEIAQMQRLSVFLGHPSYSLTVILFSLLISGGAGSLSTEKNPAGFNDSKRLIALFVSVALTGLLTQPLCLVFQTQPTVIRILLAVLLTLPMGFFMGMAFPLGLKLAAKLDEQLCPWLWGLNGAAAVCASVIAVLLSLVFGISTAFFAGVFFYFLAMILFFCLGRNRI